jgi:multidrug efflux system outer membrane protein
MIRLRAKQTWAVLLVLWGCSKPQMRSTESIELPKHWTAASPSVFGLPDDEPWWKGCGDPVCIAWIERALAQNPDVQGAIGRLLELGALYVAAAGQNGPQIQLNGFAQRFMQSQNAPLQQQFNVLVNRWYSDMTLGFASAWEVDLWGRLEALRCSAAADFEAAASALMVQSVTLPAEVATSVNSWRFAARRLQLLDQRVQLLKRRLALAASLGESGLTDGSAVEANRQTLGTLAAQVPLLQQSMEESIQRLAVLLGEYPDRIRAEGLDLAAEFQEPAFPATVPSEVLLKRPDVRQAYYQLAGAESRVALAVAQRYPVLSIAATLGLDTGTANRFLQARSAFASFGPQILQTVVDGGNLAQQAEAAAQRQAQALADFKGAVLGAFAEVENALNGSYLLKKNVESLSEAQRAAEQQRHLSRDLFARGLISESQLIDAEENWIVAADGLLAARGSLQAQWITLARVTAPEPPRRPLMDLRREQAADYP